MPLAETVPLEDAAANGGLPPARPAAETSAPLGTDDPYALKPLDTEQQEDQGGETAAKDLNPDELQFCPECGAKWKKGSVACDQCYYNAVVGARLRPSGGRKRRMSVLRYLDVTPLLLLGALGALLYGGWYLYDHAEKLGKQGASAIEGVVEEQGRRVSSPEETGEKKTGTDVKRSRNKKTASRKNLAGSGKTKSAGGKATSKKNGRKTGPASRTPAARLEAALDLLRDPAREKLGRERIGVLLNKPQTLELLGQALKKAVAAGKKEPFRLKLALAALCSMRRSPALAEAFLACLAPPDLDARQTKTLRRIAVRALARQGAEFAATVERGLQEGAPKLKAALIQACARERWRQFASAVREAAKDASPVVRRAVVEAFGTRRGLGGGTADVPLLVAAITDSDAAVAAAASRAATGFAAAAGGLLEERVVKKAASEDASPSFATFFYALRPLFILRAGYTVGRGGRLQGRAGALAKAVRRYLSRETGGAAGGTAAERQRLARWEKAVFTGNDYSGRLRLLDAAAARGKWSPKGEALYAVLLSADPQPLTRRRAAWVLSELGTGGLRCVFEAACAACFDDDFTVALFAADVAAAAPKSFEPKLLRRANPAACTDRERALRAGVLKMRGEAAAAGELRALAADESADLVARALAFRFLDKDLGAEDQPTAEALRRAADKNSAGGTVRCLLDAALARNGDAGARRALLTALGTARKEKERAVVLREFRLLKGKDVREALVTALRSGTLSAAETWGVCRLLTRRRDAELLQELLGVFPRAKGPAAEAISRAVAAFGSKAVEPLLKLLSTGDHAPDIRARIVKALGLALATARAGLQHRAGTKDPGVNILAGAEPLRPFMVRLLRRLRADDDRGVRETGAEAFRTVAGCDEHYDLDAWEILLMRRTAPVRGAKRTVRRGGVVYQEPELWQPRRSGNYGDAVFQLTCRPTNKDVANNLKRNDLIKQLEAKPSFKSDGAFVRRYASGGIEFRLAGTVYREGKTVTAVYFATVRQNNMLFDLEARFSCAAHFWAYHKPLLQATLASIDRVKPRGKRGGR